ncbi:unnamed protein product [Sphenostylis stenocarpa]|uniref:Uncharacterized protein n=1 Tax=Sphenostylis stenocarpa TaxID=92480 RepID=A0AA86W6E8_9FABA|nr:unnamed protein product [Sphenostylis stenocarpa]
MGVLFYNNRNLISSDFEKMDALHKGVLFYNGHDLIRSDSNKMDVTLSGRILTKRTLDLDKMDATPYGRAILHQARPYEVGKCHNGCNPMRSVYVPYEVGPWEVVLPIDLMRNTPTHAICASVAVSRDNGEGQCPE